MCVCVSVGGCGQGRGRGRGRPMAVVDDLPVVGAEASVVAGSPQKPTESASAGPQRPGRGKPPSHDTVRTVGREVKLSESLKLDAPSFTVTPSDEQFVDAGSRRIVEATADNIVVSINNADAAAVTPVSQKPPKIGSGRLGKTEAGSGRKPRGKRGKGQSTRTTAAEEPVTIGIAVIRTPSDQPEIQYKAVDQSPKPKGILKRTQHERKDDWVEEPVETLDWEKEIEEAQRRKVAVSDNVHKSNVADDVVKETGATEPSAVSDDDNVLEAADDDDEWEDVEDDEDSDEDVHDISAESFDEFIREHTLKLDIALATPDVTEWTAKDTSGSITTGSQDSFLKTPVGQTRVVDWGAEMDQLSQSDKLRMSIDHGE